jgi:hypothetical protein
MKRISRAAALALALGVEAALGVAKTSAQTADANQSAGSQAATIAELQKEVQALEAKVNVLQADDQQEKEADMAATTQAVLEDAKEHSQLLTPGNLSSGYDPNVGFVIRSADGAFSLHPGLLFDFRDMTSYRQGVPKGDADLPGRTGYDTQQGFDVTRMRLTFDGNYTKALTYFIQFQDDQGQAFNLYDAYATLHLGQTPFSIRFGQFKDPVYHERLISEINLLAVDRSLLESFFGGGNASRVQGASLMYDDGGQLRAQVALTDGFNSINTKFFDVASASAPPLAAAGVTPPTYGTSGRVEYALLGQHTQQFNPYKEYDGGFSALGDTQDILVVGGGYDYTQAGRNYVLSHTVDAQYDSTSGLSLYGAYLGSYRDLPTKNAAVASAPITNIVVTPGHYYDPGFVVQAGYLVTPKIEPFVRYDYTYFQGGSVATLARNEAQELTAGANYYIDKQHLKFTVDASWLPDGAPVDQDALGILADNGHQEFVLRIQFQLAI